jgi:DinB family protein
MKIIMTISVLGILSWMFNADTSASDDPRMTSDERARVVKMLNDSEREFLDAVTGVSDAQWEFKPGPFKWSIGETAQHIVLAEEGIYGLIQQALANKPNPDWESKTAGKTDVIQRILPNRTGKAQAPERLQPHAKLSREEVIKKFKEVRARTVQFAETTQAPMKQHTADNPFPIFGTLNAYQWLMYIPLHNARHDQQIAEVKAHPGFPK